MLNVSRTVPILDAGLHIPVGLKIVALLAKTFVTAESEQSKKTAPLDSRLWRPIQAKSLHL